MAYSPQRVVSCLHLPIRVMRLDASKVMLDAIRYSQEGKFFRRKLRTAFRLRNIRHTNINISPSQSKTLSNLLASRIFCRGRHEDRSAKICVAVDDMRNRKTIEKQQIKDHTTIKDACRLYTTPENKFLSLKSLAHSAKPTFSSRFRKVFGGRSSVEIARSKL